MIGTQDSSACRLTSTPFRYPMAEFSSYYVDGWFLCRLSYCHETEKSPESVTLHHDCFEILGQAYEGADKLDRLWTFALWRKPWRQASRIFLPQRPDICSRGLRTVAKKLGLPFLEMFPVEIACIVCEYSEAAPFWRLASALDLAGEFSATEVAGNTTSHALRRVASWERGREPVLCREQRRLPIIRLTIDTFGIKRIERLPDDEPPYSRTRFDELAFVIEHQADIGPGRVAVLFKVGVYLTGNPDTPGPPFPYRR